MCEEAVTSSELFKNRCLEALNFGLRRKRDLFYELRE